jgi:hypothetical protein
VVNFAAPREETRGKMTSERESQQKRLDVFAGHQTGKQQREFIEKVKYKGSEK